ncbi:MAG: hypothetical protein H8E98_02730 [Bacteroidetes bacterium]|nr:hypothetical protein [Bacteroidota bacterium]
MAIKIKAEIDNLIPTKEEVQFIERMMKEVGSGAVTSFELSSEKAKAYIPENKSDVEGLDYVAE